MSKEDILNLKPRKGIDVVFQPIKTNSNIYVATISGTDLNPSDPSEELESQNDIDNFINENLNIYSDRIKEPKDLQKIPKIARQMAMNLNDKRLDTNKYDILRSKALEAETEARLNKIFKQKEIGKNNKGSLIATAEEPKDVEEEENPFRTIQEG